MQLELGAVGELDPIDHRGGGRDQVEVELARQPLLDDLQVKEAQEAAAEAEAERRRGLHLVGEGGVIQPEPADRGAQVLEIGGVDREQAAEHHRLHLTEAGQRRRGRAALVGDGVAHGGVRHLLDLGGDEPDLAGTERLDVGALGPEDADAVDLMAGAGLHHADSLAGPERAVEHPHQHDHPEVGVVPGVHEQRLEWRVRIALRRRQPLDDRLQHLVDPLPGLGRALHGLRGVEADDVLDLLAHPVGLGGRQIDLVQHRHDLVVVVDRLIDVGEGLVRQLV